MLTNKLLVLSFFGLSAIALGIGSYENFSMPRTLAPVTVPVTSSGVNYSSTKFKLLGKDARTKAPSFNPQDYLFARESFLAEKRDESIKLLRQQMDSGMRANLDNMLLRLGQLYAEKYMELSYYENEVYSKDLEEYEQEKAKNPSAKRPKLNTKRSQRYLNDATAIFYDLEKKFPKHPRLDEISFFIGFVELEKGNAAKALKYLERVVKQFPRSRKHDEAVVYLGDYHFEKANFREAAKYFKELEGDKETPLHAYVAYKLAWCALNTGEPGKALKEMKALVAELEGASDKGKFNLREQAIKDLVVFYGETDSVDDAMEYFTQVKGKDVAVENVKLIADIMRTKAKDAGAIGAYEKLLSDHGDSIDAPRFVVGLYEGLSRLGKTDKAVDVLVDGLQKYGEASSWGSDFPSGKSEEIKENRNYLRDESEKAGYYYHNSAQKSANKGSYETALKVYNAILEYFPTAPNRKKIAFYRGEILFDQGQWLLASEAYMTAAKTPPKDKVTDESVYNALLALDKLTAKESTLERYSKQEQKNVNTKSEEIPHNEQKLIEIAQYYLNEYPKSAKSADVKFRIASTYYRYHHFDRALERFKDLAIKHPNHRASPTAAHIVLDIYNIKKDFVTMTRTAKEFFQVAQLGDATFKFEMNKIMNEVSFKKIEELEDQQKWDVAAKEYLMFYDANPKGHLAEHALYNAFVCYEKASLANESERVARRFLSVFPNSEFGPRLVLSVAKTAEKNFDIEEAQRQYSDFAKRFPKDKEAPKALYNAAVYADLLDNPRAALGLYGEYLESGYASKAEKKAVLISEAKQYRKLGDWKKFVDIYRELADDSKKMDDKLGYLGELAQHLNRAGRVKERQAILAEVLAMHISAERAKSLKGSGAQVVAEANFREVTKLREQYESIKFKFPPETLLAAMKKRERTLTQLLKAYDSVIEIGVPDWGVAALYEKSSAYGSYVTAFRGVKIPPAYTGETRAEAEKALQGIDEKLVKPLAAKGKEIVKACVARSAEYLVANEYAQKCRQLLAEDEKTNDPQGIAPQPVYWSTRWLEEK